MLGEKTFSRVDRINELIKREISDIIQNKLNDPNLGFSTVSYVSMSKDLKIANVHISILGKYHEKIKSMKALEKSKGYIKILLSKKVKLKYMPQLKFFRDDSFVYSEKISSVIDSLENKQVSDTNNGLILNENEIEKLKAIYKKILNSDNILITTHAKPDGDAVGSALSMYNFIFSLEKNVKIIIDKGCPGYLKWLPDSGIIEDNKNYFESKKFELVICIDSNYSERIGYPYEQTKNYITDENLIIIDHHKGSSENTLLKLVCTPAAAAAEIIYQFFKINNVLLNNKTALFIYIAIQTDTWMLSQNNTSSSVVSIVSELLRYPSIKPYKITERLFERKSFEATKLLGKLLNSVEIDIEHKFAYGILTQNDFNETNTTVEDTEGFINHIRAITNIKVAVIITELSENKIKVNLRAKDEIDLLPLVKKFNGGGHKQACGFSIENNLDDVKILFLNELKGFMKNE